MLLKLLARNEVVLFAMLLLPTWSASCGRDGEFVLSWIGLKQVLHHCRFARTAGRTENNNHTDLLFDNLLFKGHSALAP